jgi:hypothetical protein
MESRFNANCALDQRLERIVTSVLSKTPLIIGVWCKAGRRNSSLVSNVKKAINPMNSVIKTTANTPTNELVGGPLINFLQKPEVQYSHCTSKVCGKIIKKCEKNKMINSEAQCSDEQYKPKIQLAVIKGILQHKE